MSGLDFLGAALTIQPVCLVGEGAHRLSRPTSASLSDARSGHYALFDLIVGPDVVRLRAAPRGRRRSKLLPAHFVEFVAADLAELAQ